MYIVLLGIIGVTYYFVDVRIHILVERYNIVTIWLLLSYVTLPSALFFTF